MITEKQKLIYNLYLKYSRNGKPYKFRKNFDDISNDITLYLLKLETFFDYFKNIKIDDFFKAPYEILQDEYYELKFYLSQKAKKCYTTYMKQKRNDSLITREKIDNNIKFIVGFCKDNNIKLLEYTHYKKDNSNYYEYFTHIKDNKIDAFILYGFDKFEKSLEETPDDFIEYMFGLDVFDKMINTHRTEFYSTKHKSFIKNLIKILNEKF